MPQSEQDPTKVAKYKIPGFFVPCDLEELQELCKKGNITRTSIYDLPAKCLGSGSKVTEKQYASFRAIWPIMKRPDTLFKDAHLYGFKRYWQKAKVIVNDLQDFHKYLCVVEGHTLVKNIDRKDDAYPSSFAILRDLQELVGFSSLAVRSSGRHKRATPRTEEDSSYPTCTLKRPKKSTRRSIVQMFKSNSSRQIGRSSLTEAQLRPENTTHGVTVYEAPDEATVNAALVVLLRSFSGLAGNSRFQFVFNRVQFTSSFEKCAFSAYTDGAFESPEQTLAILEVKKTPRKGKRTQIQMQETAEMVGWLKTTSTIHGKFMNNQYVGRPPSLIE